MNEISQVVRLGRFLPQREGWGTLAGSQLRGKLAGHVAALPGEGVIKLSLVGIKRIDVAFAAEAIVGLVADHRGKRPICVVDLADPDLRTNLAAAAQQVKVPVMVWNGHNGDALGLRPGSALHQALVFALGRTAVRAAEFAEAAKVSISNASTRLYKLWTMGLLQRSKGSASSGGKEYVYRPVG
jgi:hypothetical protein